MRGIRRAEQMVNRTAANSREKKLVMTCAEFQKVLPYIIDGGGSEEEQKHLETCKVCSDLVADLRYIAEAAKLLVPMEDPNARVWNNIEREIDREGLAKPARRNM
jgi:hypothetical protein